MILVGFLFCQGNPTSLQFGVGGSMIAAGVCGWVVFAYIVLAEDTQEKLKVLGEFGVVKVFAARSVVIKDEYVRRLNAARDQIDIMGFGLSSFREDFLDELKQWKERATVRILLIDPEFPHPSYTYAAQRDNEEKNTLGEIESDVRKFAADVGPLIGNSGRRQFQIRLYRCLPSVNIFRIDDELFWGPYLVGSQSRNCPTFIVKRHGILFDRLSRQFQDIWESDQLSRPIPPDWLLKKP